MKHLFQILFINTTRVLIPPTSQKNTLGLALLFTLSNVFLPFLNVFAQNNASVTFKVSSVPLAANLLETQSYDSIVKDKADLGAHNQKQWREYLWNKRNLSDAKLRRLSDDENYPKAIQVEAASSGEGRLVAKQGTNAIASAMVQAYADHRPLVLSPDMIWLMIAQGFSAHVEHNPEAMRPYFVNFKGKKRLEVYRDNWGKESANNNWAGVFQELSDSIAKNAKGNLSEICLPQFSTTGELERVAFEVSLMQITKEFFVRYVGLSCGIPEITLEGTPKDWLKLEAHAAALEQYELAWWIQPLRPILSEFTKASEGKVDTVFWQNMVKKQLFSNGCVRDSFLTGWMLHFFPYIDDKVNTWITMPDSVMAFEKAYIDYDSSRGWAVESPQLEITEMTALDSLLDLDNENMDSSSIRGLALKALKEREKNNRPNYVLPSSMSKGEFIFQMMGRKQYDYEVLAGIIGIRQHEKTLALRPEFGWRILNKGVKGEKIETVYQRFFNKY
jgi:hypothetical protein